MKVASATIKLILFFFVCLPVLADSSSVNSASPSSLVIHSGSISFGLEAGIDFSNFIGQSGKSNSSLNLVWDGYQINAGFDGGIFTDWYFLNDFGIEFEATYVQKGSNAKVTSSGDVNNSVLSLDYFEFFLGPTYHIANFAGGRISLFAGPTVGILAASQIHLYDSNGFLDASKNNPSDYNSADYGLNLGVEWNLNQFFLRAKYQLGLVDVPKSSNTAFLPVQNQILGLTTGYIF
jgi:hypothetical protein